MSFLPALGAAVRGYTDQAAATQLQQQRALALQQAQRDLAARQLLFSGINGLPQGGQGGPGQIMPQPPMTGTPPPPGAASVPSQNPAGAPPQAPPQPTPSGMATPAAGPAPATAAPAGPSPMGGGGQDQTDFDPFHAVMRIAADLKARNPNADPQTLAAAVSQMIDLMKGIQPDIRAQMQYTAQLMAIAQRGQAATERDATQRYGIDTRSADFQQRTAAMVQMNAARIAASDQRVQFIQGAITDRFTKGLINKNIAAAQRNQLVVAKNRYDSAKNIWNQLQTNLRAGTAVDPQQLQRANDELGAAIKNLETVGNRIAGDVPGAPAPSPAPGGASSPASPPDADNPDAAVINAPDDKSAIAAADAASARIRNTPPKGAPTAPKEDGRPLLVNGKPSGFVSRGGKWVKQ